MNQRLRGALSSEPEIEAEEQRLSDNGVRDGQAYLGGSRRMRRNELQLRGMWKEEMKGYGDGGGGVKARLLPQREWVVAE